MEPTKRIDKSIQAEGTFGIMKHDKMVQKECVRKGPIL